MDARVVFNATVEYLLDRGWWRDGDDPGVWLPPWKEEDAEKNYSYGSALEVQFGQDGVEMTDVP